MRRFVAAQLHYHDPTGEGALPFVAMLHVLRAVDLKLPTGTVVEAATAWQHRPPANRWVAGWVGAALQRGGGGGTHILKHIFRMANMALCPTIMHYRTTARRHYTYNPHSSAFLRVAGLDSDESSFANGHGSCGACPCSAMGPLCVNAQGRGDCCSSASGGPHHCRGRAHCGTVRQGCHHAHRILLSATVHGNKGWWVLDPSWRPPPGLVVGGRACPARLLQAARICLKGEQQKRSSTVLQMHVLCLAGTDLLLPRRLGVPRCLKRLILAAGVGADRVGRPRRRPQGRRLPSGPRDPAGVRGGQGGRVAEAGGRRGSGRRGRRPRAAGPAPGRNRCAAA